MADKLKQAAQRVSEALDSIEDREHRRHHLMIDFAKMGAALQLDQIAEAFPGLVWERAHKIRKDAEQDSRAHRLGNSHTDTPNTPKKTKKGNGHAQHAAAKAHQKRHGGRKGHKMTPAQRKAVSVRMRKYWAGQRATK